MLLIFIGFFPRSQKGEAIENQLFHNKEAKLTLMRCENRVFLHRPPLLIYNKVLLLQFCLL